MRYLSDDDLAKYFDDGTGQQAPQGGASEGWSLDDAFANPKHGLEPSEQEMEAMRPHSVIPDPETPAPLKRPRLSERPMHPVRPVSRVSNLPPLADDLTWTGRDVQPVKSGGSGKMLFMFIAALGACAVMVMLVNGGAPESTLPQIGR